MSKKDFYKACDLIDVDDTMNNLNLYQERGLGWADRHIQALERAVSVLTGSNPEWRENISAVDAEIIDKIFCEMNKVKA